MSEMINVHVLNNEGAGFSRVVQVVAGSTVGDLVRTLVTSSPGSHKIHLNKESTTEDQVLKDGDRLVVTPQKVAGAFRA